MATAFYGSKTVTLNSCLAFNNEDARFFSEDRLRRLLEEAGAVIREPVPSGACDGGGDD